MSISRVPEGPASDGQEEAQAPRVPVYLSGHLCTLIQWSRPRSETHLGVCSTLGSALS